MKIVLPVHFRNDAWLGGANYFLGLVQALRLHPDAGGTTVIVPSNRPEAFGARDGDGVQVVDAPWLDASARADYFVNGAINILGRYNHRLYRLARSSGADVITHANPGRFTPCPVLFWMPDFQHRHLPEFFSRYERWRRDRNVAAAASSGHILFSSNSAVADFHRFFPGHAGASTHVLRFTPFFNVEPAPAGSSDKAALLSKYDLRAGYFFLPNQFWRHKNHAVVIEALRRLPDSFQVACTGAMSDSRGNAHIQSILSAIAAHGLQDRFRTLGVVPRADMLALMRHSSCVINPSLFEGWSTTVEESKFMGKQLILSDIPVHREQDPAGALYFDPQDADALAAAMTMARTTHDPLLEDQRRQAAQAAFPAAVAGFAARYWQVARAVADSRAD